MKLTDILNKLGVDENNKDLSFLVLYFCKERVSDIADDVDTALTKAYEDIPDDINNLLISKFMDHISNCADNIFFSELNYYFENDVEFLAELLNKDKKFILDTVTEFAKDYLKYHNIKVLEEGN